MHGLVVAFVIAFVIISFILIIIIIIIIVIVIIIIITVYKTMYIGLQNYPNKVIIHFYYQYYHYHWYDIWYDMIWYDMIWSIQVLPAGLLPVTHEIKPNAFTRHFWLLLYGPCMISEHEITGPAVRGFFLIPQ